MNIFSEEYKQLAIELSIARLINKLRRIALKELWDEYQKQQDDIGTIIRDNHDN